jgi:ubiquinone/menaquinone biosynthesis C-methylase UbiE
MSKGNFKEKWNEQYENNKISVFVDFDNIQTRDDFVMSLGFEYAFEFIIKNIDKPIKDIKVIEVGCGGARNSVFLASKGMQVTCTDTSDEALRLAEENFKNAGITAYTLLNDDLLNSKIPATSFDVVMSFGLLEHFEDIQTPINAIARLQNSSGIGIHDIITDRFSIAKFNRVYNFCFRFTKNLVFGNWKDIIKRSGRNMPHYENSYPLEDYENTFRKSGVDVIFSSGQVIWAYFWTPMFIEKILVNLAMKNRSFFKKLDLNQSKIMKFLGVCWLVVTKK